MTKASSTSAAKNYAWLGWFIALCSVLILFPFACSSDPINEEKTPNDGGVIADTIPKDTAPIKHNLKLVCPGSDGCASNKGELKAGASAIDISPTAYEVARFSYMREEGYCATPAPLSPYGLKRCGELHEYAMYSRRDCGVDGICPRDKFHTSITCDDKNPCKHGMECLPYKTEKRCHVIYKEADKDGSEKDGLPDWFLDCGRDRVCPCVDGKGNPSYYGKDKKCLIGHTKNPKYTGPDADGSEGNGKFEGVWMGGFDSNHPMQGKNDPIWARTLVLQTGDVTAAIVSLDTVGFFYDDVLKVRKIVEEKLSKGAVDYILISATHTHEGPDTMGQWGPAQSGIPTASGVDPKYMAEIIPKIANSVIEAYKKMVPAKLRAGVSYTGAKGFIRDSRDPNIVDDALAVIKLTTKDDKPISTLVNWGNHPEALSDTNNYLSSDFAHYLREAIEKGVPAKGKAPEIKALGGVAIYLQGAVGSLMTPLHVPIPDLEGNIQDTSNWAKAQALGHQLALQTHKALKAGKDIKAADISIFAKTLTLPVDNLAFQMAFALNIFARKTVGFDPKLPMSDKNFPKLSTEIGVIRIGDVSFFSMPGELDPQVLIGGYDGSKSHGKPFIEDKKYEKEILERMKKAPKGPYLKERIPGEFKFFVGLGNDELGYIVPNWNYVLHETQPYKKKAPGDHYEETNGLGPKTLPLLLDAYEEIFKVLKVK